MQVSILLIQSLNTFDSLFKLTPVIGLVRTQNDYT